jgi:DNA-binding MarR family transcriptional regulator
MTKETLSRALHSLSDQGLIRVSRDEVAILDRSRLEGLVH